MGLPEFNKEHISSLTYGLGLLLPINKLTKAPLNIKFDFTSLPQVSYTNTRDDWDNFYSFNFIVNWLMEK